MTHKYKLISMCDIKNDETSAGARRGIVQKLFTRSSVNDYKIFYLATIKLWV